MESKFAVELRHVGGILLAAVQGIDVSRHQVAFHVFADGVRIQAQPFRRLNLAVACAEQAGSYRVYALVRDLDGHDLHGGLSQDLRVSEPLGQAELRSRITGALADYPHVVAGDYRKQQELGFFPRPNAKPIDITGPIEWQLSDRNAEFAMHAWRFLNPIWKQLEDSSDLEHLGEALSLMQIWSQYAASGGKAASLWYDMAVGTAPSTCRWSSRSSGCSVCATSLHSCSWETWPAHTLPTCETPRRRRAPTTACGR